MSNITPSHYLQRPVGSVSQNGDTETIARNIMAILSREGNQFRELSFDEYKLSRIQDGATEFAVSAEKPHFDIAAPYCISAQRANDFCEGWYTQKV